MLEDFYCIRYYRFAVVQVDSQLIHIGIEKFGHIGIDVIFLKAVLRITQTSACSSVSWFLPLHFARFSPITI